MAIESLYISHTEETPEVDFDSTSNILKIKGRSLPEDAFTFYKPLIAWAVEYGKEVSDQVTLEFQLDYFNSSSGRYIMELLTKLEELSESRPEFSIKVKWLAEKEDEIMQDKGEEFASILKVPVEIVLM